MNIFILVIINTFIVSIHANFNITDQNPKTTTSITTKEFKIDIDRNVNPPVFQSYIHICQAITNASCCKIDASSNKSTVKYYNKTLVFGISSCDHWNKNGEYYITFNEGVFFSGHASNSSARTDPKFWNLKVVETTIQADSTISTQYSSIDTDSTVPVTTNSNATTTIISQIVINGESPPTRSAQLGMGLGILFISILLIGEIIYFKCFYHGGRRGGNYLA